MPRFLVEQLGPNIVVTIHLVPRSMTADPAVIETPASFDALIEGTAWAHRAPDTALTGLTFHLSSRDRPQDKFDAISHGLIGELGASGYRRLREDFVRFVDELSSLDRILPAA